MILQPERIHIKINQGVNINTLNVYHIAKSQDKLPVALNISWHIEENANINILNHYRFSSDNICYFSNIIFNICPYACVKNDIVQNIPTDAHILSHQYTLQEENSEYHQAVLHYGGINSRSYDQVDLLGEHANCSLKGLALPYLEQKHQQICCINHLNAKTVSQQHFKSAVGTRAMFNFIGRIYVQEQAQKIDASQTNHNMLLADSASAYTKPELEIYADDVRAAHGTTIGQVDPNKILFLQMRGLEKNIARWLLMKGFCAEMFDVFHTNAAKQKVITYVDKLMTTIEA